MKNNKIVVVVVAIVLLGAGFGGGYEYAKSQTPSRGQFANFVGGANGQFAGHTGTARTGANGGFTMGQILSKDQNGIMIKMQDGSTKIVLVGSSAQIMKQAQGTLDDLSVGDTVTVTGSANSDGSLTAQTVALRPAGMNIGSTTRQQ